MKLFFLLALMPCSLLLLFSDGASVYLLGDARTQLGLILLVPCLLLTGTENLQKHYFYGTGRVYPAAITELAEQVLRSLLVLALLWRLAPDTAEKAVGTIVLGMALCEVVSALTQTVLFRVYLGPPAGLSGEKLTPKALRGKIGRIALPLGFAALLGNLISSANAVLIPRLLVQGGMDQGEAVSAYGVTFGMTLPMLLLPTAFLSALGLVLTPKLSQYSALGQKEAIRRQVKRSVGAANLILIPALALLAAVILAARLRFRPIVMTSLAFILGMLPLVFASGPGSASRQGIGTGVFFGMLVAITVGIVFVPLFFVWVYKLKEKWTTR